MQAIRFGATHSHPHPPPDEELDVEEEDDEEVDELPDDELLGSGMHLAILSCKVSWLWHIGSFVTG